MDMTPDRWERTIRYIRSLFAPEDDHLRGVMPRAVAAGMPDIDVGAEAGKFLQVLTIASGGRLAIEVGTLAGYSAIWIARGLAPGGRLITVEVSSKHAELAQRELAAAGVAGRVSIRQGKGLEVLPALLKELGRDAADLILLDAQRTEYIPMLPTVHALLRRGGLLVIDNALDAERWTADPVEPGQQPDTMDTVNRTIAADGRFAAILVPLGNGMLVAIKKGDSPGSS